jgi:peptide/nickel transport system substrate-binding protein
MRRNLGGFAAACASSVALAAPVAEAQKSGGVLIMSNFDSPASMSMLEEATGAVNRPMMGVFNNLVMFDQHVAQNSMWSIVPDLATGWSWNEEGTELTLPLRGGVKWHDGKPFTARDVKCTWDLLTGKSVNKLRLNQRKTWYSNLEEVTTNGEYEVTFRLKRAQPSFLVLLASGWSPVYPCHVSPRDMRAHPIGTGPFKFVEFRPNERIRVARNPEYWKPGRPYLDGIEWPIVPSLATRILGFVAGSFDQVFGVTIPLLQDLKSQAPQAVCDVFPANLPRTLLVNRTAPPFDDSELRRAMALSLDHQAFIDIITLGQGDVGGAMQPPPEGVWGMPAEMLRTLPGYDPDVAKTARRRAGSWRSSATAQTTGWRSKSPPATSPRPATRPCC